MSILLGKRKIVFGISFAILGIISLAVSLLPMFLEGWTSYNRENKILKKQITAIRAKGEPVYAVELY